MQIHSTTQSKVGTAHAQLEQRLVNFFDWRGCACPEELAAETLNRAARRLAKGGLVVSLPDYCFGVAQKLVWEARARQIRQVSLWTSQQPVYDLAELQFIAVWQWAPEERRFQRSGACQERPSSAQRKPVPQCQQTKLSAVIGERPALAKRLSISLNLLRMRVYCIRAGLKKCIKMRLQQCRVANVATRH